MSIESRKDIRTPLEKATEKAAAKAAKSGSHKDLREYLKLRRLR